MATLNEETIQQLTLLSRIHCTENEKQAILKDLQKILSYIDQLQQVNTENVPPCNHVIAGVANVMREDTVGGLLNRDTFLANAPSHTAGLVRTPPVLTNK